MKNSPGRGVEVFEFNDDDEVEEQLPGKFSANFKSPNSVDPAVLTPNLLEHVALVTGVQTGEIANLSCVNVDGMELDPRCGKATLCSSPDKAEEIVVSANDCFSDAQQAKTSSPERRDEFRLDDHESQTFVSESEKRCLHLNGSTLAEIQLHSDNSDSSSSSEPIDVTSDVDESMSKSSSLSSPASEMPEDNDMFNDYAMEICSHDVEMDDMNTAVVLYPDYVVYRDRYCPGPRLIFSETCIKITGSTPHENQEAFEFEWGIEDLVRFESQWFQRVETVMIKLRLISKDAVDDDGSLHTAGIEELKIFVVESNWSQKQQDIASLHPSYVAAWDLTQDNDMIMGTDGDDSPRHGRYFPVFEESFEEVVYPKGDIDAVSISKRDVDLLQPETFINDTIIDFYINYLKNQIQPEERCRFHFFNSFFFRKLADLDKDPSSASDGKAAFQRVRKWTRKVDLFGKEFVFIPVNFSLHWSLVVICHPGEVATFQDEELKKSAKVPCILHMDSIKGNHAGLKHLIQSYLWEEWKERQKETSEEVSSRFLNLRFVSLELPQQENSFDCGLFLLHYLESFLADVPVNFSPFKIEKSSNFLSINWFPPTEASLKRALIQRLISELLQNRSEEAPSSPSSDEDQLLESNENGVGSGFHSAMFNPGPSCQQNNLSSSQAGQGIELTLLSASSMRNSQCINDSGLVLRDLFNPGTSAGSLMGQCQSLDQKSSYYHLNGAISPLEEGQETGEQFMFGEAGFNQHQLSGITSQNCGIPFQSKDFGGETFNMGISLQAKCRDINCPDEPSICDSDDSSDVAITETFPVVENPSPKQRDGIGERRSPLLENSECADELPDKSSLPLENPECDVSASHKSPDAPATSEPSQNPETMQSGNENRFPVLSLEYPDISVSQDSVVADNGICIHDAPVPENSFAAPDLSGQQAAERERGLCNGQKSADPGIDSSDDLQIVEDESVRNESDLGSGAKLLNDGLAGPKSPGQLQADNRIGSGDDEQIVGDGLAGPESPRQPQAEIGSGDDEQIVGDGLAGPESPRQPQAEIGSGDDEQIVGDSQTVNDGPVGPDSPGQQPADNVEGLVDYEPVIEDGLVAPLSPSQHPAKRPRLSPSLEDEANATALAKD